MNRRGRYLGAALLALGLSVIPGKMRAQTLAVSSPSIGFSPAGVAELNAGAVGPAGFDVIVDVESSTTGWTLSVRSDAAVLSGSGKPLADLEWRVVGSSTWTPMSTADEIVATGFGDAAVAVEWRTRLAWASDQPGDYAGNVTFTLIESF